MYNWSSDRNKQSSKVGDQPDTVTMSILGEIMVNGEDESDDEGNEKVSRLIDFIGSLTFTM